jgi:hypothetical protein
MTAATMHNDQFRQFTGPRPWSSAPLPAPAEIRAAHVMTRRLCNPLGEGQPARLLAVSAYLLVNGRSRYCAHIRADEWVRLIEGAPAGYVFSESPDEIPAWVSP